MSRSPRSSVGYIIHVRRSVSTGRPFLEQGLALSATALAVVLLLIGPAHADTFKTIYALNGLTDGSVLDGGLTAVGSILYGTAGEGPPGNGSVFSVNVNGSNFQTVHAFTTFSAGTQPWEGVTLVGSKLYGMADTGGDAAQDGTIYSMNVNGSNFQALYAFTGGSDGAEPTALMAVGSTLYGTTDRGGDSGQDGTLFSMNLNGSNFQVLHSFTFGGDGSSPEAAAPIVVGSKLYGTAYTGGDANGDGTVFSMNLDGSNFQTLHSFTGGTGGSNPFAGLTLVGSKFYGTASLGGTNDDGTVFSMNLDGSNFQTIHSFAGADGYNPSGGLTLVGSKLYGTTYNGGAAGDYGTIFSMNPDGSNFQTVHSFTNGNDGAAPFPAPLTLVGSALFGVTQAGGDPGNGGTVFSVLVPEPASAIPAVIAACGLLAHAAWRRRLPLR